MQASLVPTLYHGRDKWLWHNVGYQLYRPIQGNPSTFAPKESHNRITPWEHILQKVNSKNGMEKAAYSDGYAEREGICQLRHFTANGIALRTYCGVTPNISDGYLVSDGCVHPSA